MTMAPGSRVEDLLRWLSTLSSARRAAVQGTAECPYRRIGGMLPAPTTSDHMRCTRAGRLGRVGM